MINLKAAIVLAEINSQHKCNIKIRVSHERKTRFLSTAFNIVPDLFDNLAGKVKAKHPDATAINRQLQKIVIDLELVVSNLPPNIDMQSLMAILRTNNCINEDLLSLMQKKSSELGKIGKMKTAETYYSTYVRLKKYGKQDAIDFKSIDNRFLLSFEKHLIGEGLKTNSIGIHFRNIRAIFNQAIDDNLVGLEFYPFRKFKIKKEKTIKRSLTIDQMKQLLTIELDENESYARDMFFLSFYLLGINMVDLYGLKQIKNNAIEYRRAKTGSLYNVALLPAALQLIERHQGATSLLNCNKYYVNSQNFNKSINKFLKRIATRCNIDENLTTYYARHTWATIAAGLDIPKETIAAALGHEMGNSTTSIYIDFNMQKVNLANQHVYSTLIN